MAKFKTEDGVQFPAQAYAYVPDADKPSTWKLRLWETPQLKETARQVGMAVAALGPGFRGQRVQIPSADLPKVKRRVLEAWRKVHPDAKPEDVPSILKHGGYEDMNADELTAKLKELEEKLDKAVDENKTLSEQIAQLTKERDELKLIVDLAPEDRETYKALDDETKARYAKADAEERKRILDEARKQTQASKMAELPEEVRKDIEALRKRAEEAEAKAQLAEKMAREQAEKARMIELTKRAEERYAHIPGKAVEMAEVLKAVEDGVEDEELRMRVFEIFDKAEQAFASGMRPVGTDRKDTDGSAWSKIEAEARKVANERKVELAKAVDLVIQEHPDWYQEYIQETPQSARGEL